MVDAFQDEVEMKCAGWSQARISMIADDELHRILAMVRDGQLIQTRRNAYGLPERMDLVKGRISAHRDGFGFVIPDDGGSDLYISSREMRKVLHGDRVLAGVTGTDRQGRREGMIAEVLERANDSIVGRYVEENGIALVVPDDPRINQLTIFKPTGYLRHCKATILLAVIIALMH